MPRLKLFLFLLFMTGIGVLLRMYAVGSLNQFQAQNRNLSLAHFTGTDPSPPAQSQGLPGPMNRSSCSCAKCLTEDEELQRHRLESFGQPLLSGNYNLSLDAFNWWKHLQNERGSFSTFQATVSRLFEVFPPVPDVAAPSPDRCRTCAVVGNSANLKGSRYGKLIDLQDVVIRMNFGPIKGYEEDVGSRTTHRALYPESAMNLDNMTHLVLFPFKILDLEWLLKASTTEFTGRSYAPVLSKIDANKSLVMVVNPAFMKYVHEKLLHRQGRYPSTGFMTLVLALHICDEVRVFGFGADSEGNWSHYWQPLRNKDMVKMVHPSQHEYTAIQLLAQQAKIQFFKGV